jgi:uncharacterized membrane protein YgdD (TMEM256/DUF423 family)
MHRLFFVLGSASAGIAVALGAFGAHALKARLSPDMLAVYETGVRYQMFHALALLAVGGALTRWPNSTAITASGWLFVAGTLLFSGSLVALSLTGVRSLGAVTPVGGLAWLLGWAALAWGVAKAATA